MPQPKDQPSTTHNVPEGAEVNDLTTKEDVIKLMESSKNSQEWGYNCDKVKSANGGGYPEFWFSEVILSGLMDRTLGNGSSDIKIEVG